MGTSQPPRFVVQYEDEWLFRRACEQRGGEENTDPADYTRDKSFHTLAAARAFAAESRNALILERANMRPAGDPSGLMWDFDLVEVDT